MALFALAAAALGVSAALGAKADRKQRSGQRALNQGRKIQSLQERTQFIRQFRQARAQSLAGGIASGAGIESSGIQGTLQSVRAQATLGLAEQGELMRLQAFANKRFEQAGRLNSAANFVGAMGQIAGTYAARG